MLNLNALADDARNQFAAIDDSAKLEEAKARFLGKDGSLTALLKGLGKLPAEERKQAGERINAAKADINAALHQRREQLANLSLKPSSLRKHSTSPCQAALPSAADCIR